jgi:hypothetical protein
VGQQLARSWLKVGAADQAAVVVGVGLWAWFCWLGFVLHFPGSAELFDLWVQGFPLGGGHSRGAAPSWGVRRLAKQLALMGQVKCQARHVSLQHAHPVP